MPRPRLRSFPGVALSSWPSALRARGPALGPLKPPRGRRDPGLRGCRGPESQRVARPEAPRPGSSRSRKNVKKCTFFGALRRKVQGEWGGSAHSPDPTAQSATQSRRRASLGPAALARRGPCRGGAGGGTYTWVCRRRAGRKLDPPTGAFGSLPLGEGYPSLQRGVRLPGRRSTPRPGEISDPPREAGTSLSAALAPMPAGGSHSPREAAGLNVLRCRRSGTRHCALAPTLPPPAPR